MRKVPRVGATAAGALVTALAASAFAAAPAAPATPAPAAPARSTARATALASTPLAKIQPGGPVTATGRQRSAALAFSNGTSSVVSNNWGGYVAGRTGVKFRYIRATFFVPYLDCTSAPSSFSGHWVGLDGFGGSTVEQDGILAACQGGNPEYSAWYEMFPLPPVYSRMQVLPGDSIGASVYYNAHSRKFVLNLTDTTTRAHFTTTQRCPAGASCQRLTAEAISEAPSSGTSILPLSNFRAEGYSDVAVTSQGGRRGGLQAPGWDTLAVTTEDPQGAVMDQPTSLARGKAFECYWMAPN
jgi:hypothetical protein